MAVPLRRRTVLLALPFASPIAFAQQQDAPEVPAPRLQPGDEWNYQVVDLWHGGEIARQHASVVSVAGDEAMIRFDTKRVNEDSPRSRTTAVDMRSLTEINPARGNYFFLGFPLKPGKSWQFDFPNDAPKRATNSVERWGKVAGWESVSVPAGTFRALRVEIKERRMWQVGDGVFPDHHFHTIWYVPEVKRFVRFEREHRAANGKRWSYEGTLLEKFSVG
jgi:hypothetical protein